MVEPNASNIPGETFSDGTGVKADFVTLPRVHFPALPEVLRRAELICFDPPAVVASGQEWKPISPADRRDQKAEIVRRAKGYARWRVNAYETGVCSSPW